MSAPQKKKPNGNKKKKVKKVVKKKQPVKVKIVHEEERGLITPVAKLIKGIGVLDTIVVPCVIDALSLRALPLGLVSMMLARGGVFPYQLYTVMYGDVAVLISGGVGTAPARLRYQNDIYGSMVPKTVPFRSNAMLSYAFEKVNTNPPPDSFPCRGFNYYMYEPSGVVGSWAVQTVPGPFTVDEARANYNNSLTRLSGRAKHTEVVRDVTLTKMYIRDVSAYTRVSTYYGDGASVGGPFSSVELEVPFRSKLLGTFTEFDLKTPRASRVLDHSTGDSCSNYGLGALDCFPTAYYNGALSPIYKFLDLDEVCYTLGFYLLMCLYERQQQGPLNSQEILLFDGGFGCSYQAFRLAVRQQILWMFADSQCLAQFQVPDTAVGAFETFRCGSNCCPRQPGPVMQIPFFLNENLRGLMMDVKPYITANFNSPNNHVTYIPVWGCFKNTAPPPLNFFNSLGAITPLFTPIIEADIPNVWDGTNLSGDVVDLNRTDYLSAVYAKWNDWAMSLKSQSAGLTPMGGQSNGSAFIQFTRYVDWVTNPVDGFVVSDVKYSMLPGILQRMCSERDEEIVVKSRSETPTPRLEKRSVSQKEVRKIKVFNPPNSIIFTERTILISGAIPITETHKESFNNFILPVMEIVPGPTEIPQAPQIQVSTLEPFSISFDVVNDFVNSRGIEISDAMVNMVVGRAGQLTEIAKYVRTMSMHNEGGFFGDLFSTIGTVASAVGFGGVGNIASTIGKVVTAAGG